MLKHLRFENNSVCNILMADGSVRAVPSKLKEEVLRLSVVLPEPEGSTGPGEPERRIAAKVGIEPRGRAADPWLLETVRWTWKFKMSVHLDLEIENRLREQAEVEAIRVFGTNLHDLLLAAPAGQRVTMGLDPGIRTGVKVAVVDAVHFPEPAFVTISMRGPVEPSAVKEVFTIRISAI